MKKGYNKAAQRLINKVETMTIKELKEKEEQLSYLVGLLKKEIAIKEHEKRLSEAEELSSIINATDASFNNLPQEISIGKKNSFFKDCWKKSTVLKSEEE
jgi:hypothetical protein